MSAQTENKSRLFAILFTLGFHALLFLLFILIIFVTPIPPFEIVPIPEVEIELGLGMSGMGENAGGSGQNDPDLATSPASSNAEDNAPNVMTDNASDAVVKTNPNNTTNTNSENITPPVKEPTPLEKLLAERAAKNKNKGKGKGGKDTGGSGEGDKKGVGNGNDDEEGNDPFNDGSGGTADGYELKGWNVVKKPNKLTDAEEEGIVVVKITINEEGKVVGAEPGQRNSTTTSAKLYAKARQAAFQIKYKLKDGVDVKKTQRQAFITFKFTLE